MTGFGFCGPVTAMGTVFDPKAEAAAPIIVSHALTGISGVTTGCADEEDTL